MLHNIVRIAIFKTIILPVVLYGRETCSLTFREDHKLRVSEIRVLRIMYLDRRQQIKEKCIMRDS
jgi:hypothetical protein